MENTKKQRTLLGIVAKITSPNTVSVRVERKQPHPLYGKIVKQHKKYLADISPKMAEVVKVGDSVEIGEIKPISKKKAWQVIKVIDLNSKK